MTTTQTQETWVRAVETEPSVTITEETFFSHGWQPLTITVLQAIWFLPPGEEFSPRELAGWFRSLGWKAANGRPLSEEAVQHQLKLIREAGYIRAYRVRGEAGKLGGIRYEVSKRQKTPQERVEYVVDESTKPQVTPEPANEGSRRESETDKAENRRSHLNPSSTWSGDSPDQVDDGKPQVTPEPANEGSRQSTPPHPPGRVVDTTPNPLHAETAARTPEGEEALTEDDNEALTAAQEFLLEMPAPWTVGIPTAHRYAPLLVRRTRTQGWDLDEDLVRELTKSPQPHTPPAALKKRIDGLVRRHRAGSPALPQQTGPLQPGDELPPHCGHLDCDQRTRLRHAKDKNGFEVHGPCPECHPDAARTPQLTH